MKLEMSTKTYRVCSDCATAIKFNDFPLDRERRQAISSGIRLLGSHLYVDVESHGSSETPCECCGSNLPGDRFTVVKISFK